MNVGQLIEALQKMPPDAEVFYVEPPVEGMVFYADVTVDTVTLEDDGRVCVS